MSFNIQIVDMHSILWWNEVQNLDPFKIIQSFLNF